jgi:predicted metal-dependent peptidase
MINIANNKEFNTLFKKIKQSITEEGVEYSSLENDMIELFNNMIAAIELGKGDEAFVGMFLPKINRVYDFSEPFIAGIAIINETITLKINPLLFFNMCDSYEDFVVVITHEIYHLVFKHLNKERMLPNHKIDNISKDISVNQYINFSYACSTLRDGCCKLADIQELNPEPKRENEYYYDLIINSKNIFNDGNEENNNEDKKLKNMLNDLKDLKDKLNNNDLSEEEKEQIENDIKELKEEIKDYIKEHYKIMDIDYSNNSSNSDEIILNDLVESTLSEAKEKGKIPSKIKDTIDDLYYKKPIISWKKELRNIVGSVPCPYKKTMRVKNRRQPRRADLLGKVNDRKIRIAICIDTSGSVSNEELKYFFNELFNIVKDYNTEITLIQCDSRVNSVDIITNKRDVSKIAITGRGGTCFTPAFEYIKENIPKYKQPNVIIYFTDGWGESTINLKYKPMGEIMWVLTGNTHNTLSVKTPEFIKKVRLLNIEGKKYI